VTSSSSDKVEVSVQNTPKPSRRDRGLTTLIEGFFAAAWFGWGHAAPSGLETWFTIGSIAALLLATTGAVVAFRSSGSTAALRDRDAARRYGITVGVEFTLAGIGAGVLAGAGYPRFIPVLVCAIVGLHFFPLFPVLGDRMLRPLGALMCVVAVTALVTALTTGIAASTVTGVGAGSVLLVFSSLALALAVTRQPRTSATT
jgi:hypothetical protein